MKTLKFKPYFIEPLRSMRKISTIRKSDKGLKKEDIVECVFEGTNFSIFRIVESVEQIKFKELDNARAWFEGYRHVDLLKHGLKSIYPDIHDDTVLFQIKFERPSNGLNKLRFREESNNNEDDSNNSIKIIIKDTKRGFLDNWSEKMKEGILIELLKKVSPDTEVMCRITTDDFAQLTNMTVVDIEALEKYEAFVLETKMRMMNIGDY